MTISRTIETETLLIGRNQVAEQFLGSKMAFLV